MPPVTRKLAAGATSVVAKKAPARKPRPVRPREASESWGYLEPDEHSVANTAMTPLVDEINIDEALHPLREMAERVGREVETFAERLDEFLEHLPAQDKFNAVLVLVEEFKHIAKDAAFQLEESNQRERAEQLRKEWTEQAKLSTNANVFSASTDKRLSSLSGQRSAKHKQWRESKQEADLWELFDLMLKLHHNPDKHAVQHDKEAELARLGRPHRYSGESEVWEHFLLCDDLARERSLIKRWLEDTVDHQESDLPGIMEELETRAQRGKGLWSSGWMATREKIKGEKRLRSWPTSPGAALPQIRSQDNTELLVTTLDPDARSRQGRALEKEDMYFERAIWIACWEMLRRGKSWEYVSQWCESRKEGWRALSIGKGSDAEKVVSNAAWRKMCFLASQSGCSNDYEAAVYGLLGGSVKAVNKICRTVDDTLYSHYSASLLRQFDHYLAMNFPERAPSLRRVNEDSLQNPEEAIVSLIAKLRQQPTTSTESIQPMKIVQSYLLANDVGSFIHALGHAIAYLDSQNDTPTKMIVPLNKFWTGGGNLPEQEVATDPRALRVANHMAILLRVLGEEQLDGDTRDAEENVIVAYIQTLRAARKRDLIPLYASRLSHARATLTMSYVLQDVSDYSEQEELLKLLAQYQLDNVQIINVQLRFVLEQNVGDGVEMPIRMLEYNTTPITYPGQCIVDGFYAVEPTEEDDAVVRSLRWFTMLEGHWAETFSALSLALRKCLVAGRLACAVAIVAEFPFEQVSTQKSYSIFGTTINFNEYDGVPSAVDPDMWKGLLAQSKTYQELECLVRAIASLANWRAAEHDYTRDRQKQFSQSRAPVDLRDAKAVVDECMEPVLDGVLAIPVNADAEEIADLEKIRIDYIPEVVIAYNTVLHTAGSLISRQNLIASMDLSVKVANEENGLAEIFVKAKRMRELVTSFAMTSKAMLVLKDAGREWKPKRDREGKDLGMWETMAPPRSQLKLEEGDAPQQILL